MSVLRAHALVEVAEVLARLAPPGVRTACRAISDADLDGLAPVEAAAVERAVPKRRREFATGRVLLRSLLPSDEAVPVGEDRAPVLPAGYVGSLAHCEGLAVAAVAPAGRAAALGIDVEPDVVLDAGTAQVVLRPDDDVVDAHLAFTLKEAVYKAWSRLGGGLLDHHDVRLSMGPGDRFSGRVDTAGITLAGRWAGVAGHWVALVAAPPGTSLDHGSVAR